MLSSSVEAVDEETLHALLMHLGDVPSGAIAAAAQAAPNAPAKLETTSSPAFLSGTFSGLANECGKGDANADDDIPEYALPDAQYIERTMLPLLLRGLEVVAQVRPPDPLAFLGAYMICNNPQKPPAENSSSASAKGLERVLPIRGGAPVDDTAPPALEEVVTQAMSRFTTSKSDTSATPKPTVAVGRAASAGTKNA